MADRSLPRPHARDLRRGRWSEPGRTYLITTTCAGRCPVLSDPALARLVANEIRWTSDTGTADTLAWVVMPDHLHWLMTLVAGEGLSSLVGRFKGRTARVVNVHRGLSGRVWQPGFHDRAIRDETDLHGAFVYIVENTVRAGLVSRPEDYPFWGTIAEPAVPATVRRGLWPDPCPGRYRA